MKLSELQEMMDEDSRVDKTALDAESIKLPYLHSKWYKLYIDELRAFKGIEFEYNVLYKEKMEYYLGKSPDEVYESRPLQHKILRQDVDVYLNADNELCEIQNKKSIQKMKIDMIDSFLKSISQRSFNIKNAIEWCKFQNGQL